MSEDWSWDRFKTAMESAGVKGDDRIAWIDWSSPADSVKVSRRSDDSLRIVAGHRYQEIDDGE